MVHLPVRTEHIEVDAIHANVGPYATWMASWLTSLPGSTWASGLPNSEHGQHCRNGPPAMAQRMLGFQTQFGHRAVEFGQVEEGIVAKAASPPRSLHDCALNRALGGIDRKS